MTERRTAVKRPPASQAGLGPKPRLAQRTAESSPRMSNGRGMASVPRPIPSQTTWLTTWRKDQNAPGGRSP